MTVLSTQRSWWLVGIILTAGIVLLCTGCPLLMFALPSPPSGTLGIVLTLFVLGVVILLTIGNSRSFVIIGDDGLTYKRPLGQVHRIPWKALEILMPADDARIYLVLGERRKRVWLPLGFLWTADRVAIYRVIAQAWRDHRSESAT